MHMWTYLDLSRPIYKYKLNPYVFLYLPRLKCMHMYNLQYTLTLYYGQSLRICGEYSVSCGQYCVSEATIVVLLELLCVCEKYRLSHYLTLTIVL